MVRSESPRIRVETLARLALVQLVVMLISGSAGVAAQEVTSDPDRVRLEVEDIRRLAQVLRAAGTGVPDTAGMLERDYLAHGSPGLGAYASRYEVTGATIASALADHPGLFTDLDALADGILAQDRALRSGFRELIELFPGAAFPPIWFVVGHNGPAGMTQREGVVIAAERFKDNPHDVVPLVLHELAHFQQAMVQGVEVYRRIYGPEQTLLALALREGSADLIAELTTGLHINPEAERYGLAHEPRLWSLFESEMHQQSTGDWMFVRPANGEWPSDLGYWIGHRIAASYYDRAKDKRQAIVDILGLTDFDRFLRTSRYAERFGTL